MFNFLEAWFGKARDTSKPRPRKAQLRLEAFEARDVPSAGPWMHAGFASALKAAKAVSQASVAGTMKVTSANSSVQVFSATLTGATGTSGKVKFVNNTTASTNTLTVSVSGLAASSTFNVQVNGTTVGTITTKANGKGSATIKNITATVAAGTVLTVVDSTSTLLTGTFAEGGGGCHGGKKGSSFKAELTGATGTSGKAKFWADPTGANNALKVRVSGLTASTVYTINLNGTAVGTLTTDANGAGTITLKNITGTVAVGSTLNVTDSAGATVVSGTFAAAGKHK